MSEYNDCLVRYGDMRRDAAGLINLNPIQRGGILSEAAKRSLLEWSAS
jgi:Cys-tRNA synthase (O-phospho-L-seryl-tRNA:Cys-tRNA synthase)